MYKFGRNRALFQHIFLRTLTLVVLSFPRFGHAQAPVFTTVEQTSSVKFYVKASVALLGTFQRWKCSLTFAGPDVTTGNLDISIDADSVNTGSGVKDGKLRSKDFFNASEDPSISFHSTKIVQTSSDTFDVHGIFTIRGTSKPETLKLTVSGKGSGVGTINGSMAFDRKDYGMNAGIPFVKIADRVEVSVDLNIRQTSGPKLIYQH